MGWCSDNNLELNVSKTKEIIMDFCRKKCSTSCLTINGAGVELVDSFKLLGIVISSDRSWENKSTSIVNMGCQVRLHLLRQLKNFAFNQSILTHFYRSVIEGIICFGITVWFGGKTSGEKGQLERFVKHASLIVGRELPSVAALYRTRLRRRASKLICDRRTLQIICFSSSLLVGVTKSLGPGCVVSGMVSFPKPFLHCSLHLLFSCSLCMFIPLHQNTIPCTDLQWAIKLLLLLLFFLLYVISIMFLRPTLLLYLVHSKVSFSIVSQYFWPSY